MPRTTTAAQQVTAKIRSRRQLRAEAASSDRTPLNTLPAEPPPAPKQIISATSPKTASPGGKIGLLVRLLRRPEGAGVAEMVAATGWQAHSVRGALSGAVKKKLGFTLAATATEAGRVYRIVEKA